MKAVAESAGATFQRAITAQIARIAADYFGAVDALIDESRDRAKRIVKEHP